MYIYFPSSTSVVPGIYVAQVPGTTATVDFGDGAAMNVHMPSFQPAGLPCTPRILFTQGSLYL